MRKTLHCEENSKLTGGIRGRIYTLLGACECSCDLKRNATLIMQIFWTIFLCCFVNEISYISHVPEAIEFAQNRPPSFIQILF